jgi:hypothetical protein
MTARNVRKARRVTVALSRAQVESIVFDMGWEPEDADVLWDCAMRETRNPGCLERARRKYFQKAFFGKDEGR